MDAKQQAAVRPRMSYACEACRAAKVKCQPSTQQSICRRCSDSKRECVFKTGPRTRRPRQGKIASSSPSKPAAATSLSSPPGPSKTFTIDIPMPSDDEELSSNLEALRIDHGMYLDNSEWFSSSPTSETSYDGKDDRGVTESFDFNRPVSPAGSSSVNSSHASSLPVGASAFSSPPSTTSLNPSKTRRSGLASLGVRPQFNLDSAAKLLSHFEKGMLVHFPCALLNSGEGEEVSVGSLARSRPFVLLAILAAASGSRTLQGHSLYDEEFRKVLGLKFVAGGERSLELLMGLVIYTAWYPFHLRPKNKQAFQYIRMAVDIVNDLELDQLPEGASAAITDERLTQIRTYLSTYYLSSASSTSWTRPVILPYTPTTTCLLHTLEVHSAIPSDKHLVWLVRLQHVVEEVSTLTNSPVPHPTAQNEYQLSLLLRGMAAQLDEWEAAMTPAIASVTSIRLALLFARIYIAAAPIIPSPSVRRAAPRSGQQAGHRPDADRLAGVIPTIKALLELVLVLGKEEMNSFDGAQWGRFIITIILAFKMSFPLEGCEGWRDGWARREIGLGGYLDRLAGTAEEGGDKGKETGGRGQIDVVSASKVVLEMVKRKWERRAARMDRREAEEKERQLQLQQHPFGISAPGGFPMDDWDHTGAGMGLGELRLDRSMQGCPMIDGTMDSYLSLWDEPFASAAGHSNLLSDMAGIDTGPGAYPLPSAHPDLWETLNMDWAAQWPQSGVEHGELNP